jgi:Fe2+ transport system protein FeoA
MTEPRYEPSSIEPGQGPSEAIPLSQLGPGGQAVIIRVGGNGLARRRYLEMGLVRGETIEVKRVAPLGDPVEYQIKGYHLSLRRADASVILVRPLDGGDDG